MASAIKSKARKVICIGRNYADHITELGNARPKQPFFFLKPPSSILLPRAGPVLQPKGVIMHYEVELGLIMGRTLRNFQSSDTRSALDAIKGFFLGIDMTARNVQDEAKKKGLPWSIAKGFDTFLPISEPVQKKDIRDPHDVRLWLSINGEKRQDDSTNLMLFNIPRQLSEISKIMTLEEDDLVLTGTPKGVGRVTVGDKMTAGLTVDGNDLASIDVDVAENEGPYEFRET